MGKIRTFDTGANRNSSEGKRDIEGFISPIVIKMYADYMHENRHLANGEFRASDNWQKGMSNEVYMKCLQRHNLDAWLIHRGYNGREDMIHALCGIMFNTMGLLNNIAQDDKSLWDFDEDEK